jgi:hypothetical protein
MLTISVFACLDLRSEFGFFAAYISAVSVLLAWITLVKCAWLMTRGVLPIPDGKPYDPDNILSAFPVIGPIPVHPPGTPWSCRWLPWVQPSSVPRIEELSPSAPDPPKPKTGQWEEQIDGKPTPMRWTPDSYSKSLAAITMQQIYWAISGPLTFSVGTVILINHIFNFNVQMVGSGLLLIGTSLISLHIILRHVRFLSQFMVDAPAVLVAGRWKTPALISAYIEAVFFVGGFAIAAMLLRYSLKLLPTARAVGDLKLFVIGASGYAAVALIAILLRLFFAAVRPIGQGRLRKLRPREVQVISSGLLSVAHWSDLHLTSREASSMLDGNPSPNGT